MHNVFLVLNINFHEKIGWKCLLLVLKQIYYNCYLLKLLLKYFSRLMYGNKLNGKILSQLLFSPSLLKHIPI